MRLPISLLPAFCSGIAFAFILDNLPNYWLVGLIALFCGLLCRYKLIFAHLFFLVLGLIYGCLRIEFALENRLPIEFNKQPYTLQITVEDIPKLEAYGVRFTAKVSNPPPHVPQKIVLTDYEKNTWVSGSTWQISTKLSTPVGLVNQAGLNKETLYLNKGIGASGNIQKGQIYLGESKQFSARLDRFRYQIAQRIKIIGQKHPRGAALIAALTIGDQNALTQDDWQIFRQTGIIHLISISGLHITMIAVLIGSLSRYVVHWLKIKRVQPRTIMVISGVIAAFCYALLAGLSVPTQRSLFMLTAAAILTLSRHHFTTWQIWWISLTTVLLISPLAILSIGFWLSFGFVAILLWIGTNRRKQQQKTYLLAIKAQVTASIASIVPLSFFFGQLPIISPIINLVAIPWVSWVLTPLALFSLCLPFDTPLEWICLVAEWSLQALDFSLYLAYEYVVAKPPVAILILGIIGTFLALTPRGTPLKYLGVCCIILILCYQPNAPKYNEAKITILDIGQGSSMLVQTQNHSLLFDTGMGSANWTVLPNLRAKGIRKLDKLVLSHHDADHDMGRGDIIKAYPNVQVEAGQIDTYPEIPQIRYCQGGQEWLWDGIHFKWLTLEPFAKNNNDMSCVLKISTDNHSLLITGDLSKKGEKKLIENYGEELSSQILVLGHHGSQTSSSRPFLQAVHPQYAITSAGFANRFRHPNKSVIERIESQNIQLFRTDLQGAIEINMTKNITISPQTQQKKFWQMKPFLAK